LNSTSDETEMSAMGKERANERVGIARECPNDTGFALSYLRRPGRTRASEMSEYRRSATESHSIDTEIACQLIVYTPQTLFFL